MASNVFISFRYSDGINFKNELAEIFSKSSIVYDYSEDKDRSNLSDEIIKEYLYKKLKRSSVIVALITPLSINYTKISGSYNDWIYDEIRYSLEERENNSTKGIIGVYTPGAESIILSKYTHTCNVCNKTSDITMINSFDNLVRKNMMNVKDEYKLNKCKDVYDSDFDSYASLISFDEFKNNYAKYIDIASKKKETL